MISFAATDQKPPPTRINVYYTTGTVGTCLDHPRQGKTQLFRRNVDLSLLAQLFRDPRLHTGTGYHRRSTESPRSACQEVETWANKRGPDAVESPRPVKKFCEGMPSINDPLDEEAELRAQVTRLKAETADVESILAACVERREAEERRQRDEAARLERERQEEQRRRYEQEAKVRREREAFELQKKREARGTHYDFYLSHGAHVQKNFCSEVTCVATNGTATIMLYEDGDWTCSNTSAIPKLLYNKLNGRQKSLPSPVYVALGSMGRYYIKFADGNIEWVGCDDMTKAINETSRREKTVAFGEGWDSFFLVFEDGLGTYRGVPDGLSEKLKARDNKSDLKCVSLGGDGAWYLEAMNGRSWWGGAHSKTMSAIGKIKDRLTFLDFGPDDGHGTDYFARYE